MVNRINLLLKAKNLTAKQFADEIGIQPSGMSHILSGRNNPSLDFVTKVIKRYPEIDIRWLMFGIGEMYDMKNKHTSDVNTTIISSQSTAIPSETSNVDEVNKSQMMPNGEVDLFSMPNDEPEAKDKVTIDNHSVNKDDRKSEVSSLPPSVITGGDSRWGGMEESFVAQSQGTSSVVDPKCKEDNVDVQASVAPHNCAIPQPPADAAQSASDNGVSTRGTNVVRSAVVESLLGTKKNAVDVLPDKAMDLVPEKDACRDKKMVKVLVFYDDHTFAEYKPE